MTPRPYRKEKAMAKRGKLTRNAKAFMAANAAHGVVQGSVSGPHGGAKYLLANGRTFTLSPCECRAVGAVHWQGAGQ